MEILQVAQTYRIISRLVILKISFAKEIKDKESINEDYGLFEDFKDWLDEKHILYDNDETFVFDENGIGSSEYTFEDKSLPEIIVWLNARGITEAEQPA